MDLDRFRVCSTCRKEIPFEGRYYVCSVSTCNRKRTGVLFCSMACWDAHLPEARHREAWAEERRAPTRAEWATDSEREPEPLPEPAAVPVQPPRRLVVAPPASPAPAPAPASASAAVPIEVLVVVSKLKGYVKARHGMNTSDGVIDVLSSILRRACDDAAARAAADGRKTIMDRDFPGYK